MDGLRSIQFNLEQDCTIFLLPRNRGWEIVKDDHGIKSSDHYNYDFDTVFNKYCEIIKYYAEML